MGSWMELFVDLFLFALWFPVGVNSIIYNPNSFIRCLNVQFMLHRLEIREPYGTNLRR